MGGWISDCGERSVRAFEVFRVFFCGFIYSRLGFQAVLEATTVVDQRPFIMTSFNKKCEPNRYRSHLPKSSLVSLSVQTDIITGVDGLCSIGDGVTLRTWHQRPTNVLRRRSTKVSRWGSANMVVAPN